MPRADASAFADALDALMTDPGERAALGERARRSVEPYRAERILDAWEDVIAKVLR